MCVITFITDVCAICCHSIGIAKQTYPVIIIKRFFFTDK